MTDNIKKRGFASMTPERLREITSRGGKSSGSNFKNNPELASIAGKRSVEARRKKRDHGDQL